MMRIFALGSALGVALTFAAGAHAAPLGGKPGIELPGVAHSIQYRRCWYDDGRRVCRFVYGYRDRDWRGDRDRGGRWWRGRDLDRRFRDRD